MGMPYQLIAIDIDDTLLHSDLTLSDHTVATIQKAAKMGKFIVLASGRAYSGIKPFYDIFGIQSPAITFGGNQIMDKDGNAIVTHTVSTPDCKKILELAQEYGVHAHVYHDGLIWYPKYNKYAQFYADHYGCSGEERADLLSREDLASPKVLMMEDDTNKILEIQQRAQKLFPHLNVMRSKPTLLEFTDKSYTKGRALQELCDSLGLSIGQTIAIGDSQIDASMIRAAGLGVAVGNAIDEVKDIADFVAPSNDQDGVAFTIEKFMIEGGSSQ